MLSGAKLRLLQGVKLCTNMVSVLEGKLLVCGGMNVMQELQSLIQQYDPQAERWSVFGELPFSLKGN